MIKQILAKLYFVYFNHFPIDREKNLLARILTKMFGTFYAITDKGILLEIFIDSQMDTSYYLSGFDNNNLIISEINKLKEGDIFLDIGANIGYYSIFASRIIGNSGRVYAFEPSNREFRRLLRNIELNHCSNIIPINIALSNSNNEINFSIASGHTGLNSFTITDRAVEKSVQIVKPMRLDTYFDTVGQKIQLVKIDVEGSELFVLKGMEALLKDHLIQRIIIEITPRFFNSFSYRKEDVYNLLYRYGFKSLVNSDIWQYDEIFELSLNN